MSPSTARNSPDIDLTHLRTITEGDRELEEKLFSLFFETSERCIGILESALASPATHWRDAAHELKGASASVGAQEMQNLCMMAETIPEIDAKHRNEILTQLRDAFSRARQFYLELHS